MLSLTTDDSCTQDLGLLTWAMGDGMTLVFSNTGDTNVTMDWLNKGLCDQNCTNNPTITINNINVNYQNSTVTPMPSNYSFGGECISSNHGECGIPAKCNKDSEQPELCKWSWPQGDDQMWNSQNAKCRCQGWKNQVHDLPPPQNNDAQFI